MTTQQWTSGDIQRMNHMVSMKMSFAKIAKVLGRSPLAVKYKFSRQYRKKIKSKIYIPNTDSSDNLDEEIEYDENYNIDSDNDSDRDSIGGGDVIDANTYSRQNLHKRTLSNESDSSIYVKYSPPVNMCTLFGVVFAGTFSIITCGSYVYMKILLDSIQKINSV